MATLTPDDPDFSYDDSPHLYLFTSLTAGSSHIITATSRMETILKANRIPFRAVDCATDDKARQVWARRSRGKRLPGLVKEGFVLGDLPVVEEWNEYGEIKMHLANAKKPQPAFVQEGPPPPGAEPSPAQETKPKGTAEPGDLASDDASITSANSLAHAQHGQLAVEAAAAAAARKANKSPLPVLKSSQDKQVHENDDTTEQNTIHNIDPASATAAANSKQPTEPTKDAQEQDDEPEAKTQDQDPKEEPNKNRFSVASASPKPLRHQSKHSRSNSARRGEGDDVDLDAGPSSISHATIAHPALSPPAAAGDPGGSSGRSSMLRRAQDELEALLDLKDDGRDTVRDSVMTDQLSHAPPSDAAAPTAAAAAAAAAAADSHDKPDPPAKDSIDEPHAHFGGSSSTNKTLPFRPGGHGHSSEKTAGSNDLTESADHDDEPRVLDEKTVHASAPRDSAALEDEAAKNAGCCKACIVM